MNTLLDWLQGRRGIPLVTQSAKGQERYTMPDNWIKIYRIEILGQRMKFTVHEPEGEETHRYFTIEGAPDYPVQILVWVKRKE